jgi:hypothetical protein
MRMALVVLIVACGLLLSAQVAAATELPSSIRDQITTIVNQPDPGNRCTGHVHLIWAHDLQATQPGLAARDLRILEYAYGVIDGSCDVAVRSDLEPQLACTVALHGREHLMGVGHNTGDPLMGDADGNIGTYRDPRCAGVLILDRLDALDAVWARVSSRTHVTCRRAGPGVFMCTSYHGRLLRKTWLVKALPGDRVSAKVVAAIA